MRTWQERAQKGERVHFLGFLRFISSKAGGGRGSEALSRDSGASRLRLLPCPSRTTAWRWGEADRERTKNPSRSGTRSPARPGRSAFGSPEDAPPRVVCDPSPLALLTPYSSFPGPARVPALNTPSSKCDGGGDSSWKPGLSPLPPRPVSGCPKPLGRKAARSLPGTLFPPAVWAP